MTGYLLSIIGILTAGLLGCLWYVLSRVGTRLDGVDGRLRSIEQDFATVQSLGSQFETVDGRVRAVEDRMIRWEERFSYAEEQIMRILQHTESLDKRAQTREGESG